MSELIDGVFDPRTEIGRGLAAVDWSDTALGPVSQWPPSLRNAVRLQLGSRFAMWMAWGPELVFLCNDAYRRDTLGAKYPWALGRRAEEVWSEIWPDIGPRITSVIETGEATWDEGLLLMLERSGYQEETYHTFSYSPLTDDDGAVAGMLCVVSEETTRVIGQQRMQIVRDLGTGLSTATTVAQVNSAAAAQLGAQGRAVPFSMAYLMDEAGAAAQLAWTAGIPRGHPVAPAELRGDAGIWPLTEVGAGRAVLVDGLGTRVPDVPRGEWDRPVDTALLLPLVAPGQEVAFGFLVAGLNRHRTLDEEYRGFLDLIAGQLSAALFRARAFAEERRRAEELAALDRAKTTFFTNVSHELRTPLTLLLGPSADALADTEHPLPGPQRERVDVVQRNAERLLKLVNTLLDFSRLESGRATALFEPLDLCRYTAELAAMFESAMRRAGLEFEVSCEELPEDVYVDREMWSKIVLNLVSNALKATFTGSVGLRLRPDGDGVLLTVSDTGIGIPEAEQARLFERFHRVVGADLRSHEGSGIGLALVAELVALHGGMVAVESRPGEGSTFSVRLPAGTAHLPAEQVRATAAIDEYDVQPFAAAFLSEAERWLDADRPADGGDVVIADRPHVLVVDDNADMRTYVAGLLSARYAVTTAVDGRDGLDAVRAAAAQRPVDLVLTDVMMPRVNGFELLAELRQDEATVHLPVVMLSARSGEEAAVEGLEAGADDYLVKPFSGRELLARVASNLELDRARRLAHQLDRSRSLLDQAEGLAQVGSWELELGTARVVASDEYLRMLGTSRAELDAPGGVERAFAALHADDRPAVQAALQRCAQTGEPLDLEARVGPAGRQRLIRARGTLHRDDTGAPSHIRGSVQDITDQRLAEQSLAAAAAAREAAAREHAIAEELQRSLLPAYLPNPDGLKVGVYYAAGVAGTQAGGDWYDVIELPGGRAALVIGDVMGRGIRAAAAMGQVRATVRAYARLDVDPGELVRLLDSAVRDIDDRIIVTCLYGVLDPATGVLTYANAGHLPPLVAVPGGPPQRLEPGDPPLGSGGCRGRTHTVTLAQGSRLLLYTDGLVEQRDSDLDVDIDRAAAALAASTSPVEGVPGDLVRAMLPQDPGDDVAIVVAELDGSTPDLLQRVTPTPRSLPRVRAAVRDRLAEWGAGGSAAEDVELLVSELVGNAIRHAVAPIWLRMRRDRDRVVIDVSDGADAVPQQREVDLDSPDGRGLFLVDALSSAWGVRPTGAAKSVWCTVPLDGVPPPG